MSISTTEASLRRRQRLRDQSRKKSELRKENNKQVAANRKAAGVCSINGTQMRVDDDAKRFLASIPPDTRDLTARVFGDPPPGRSALDKIRQQGGFP